jgi:hypothetical protein
MTQRRTEPPAAALNVAIIGAGMAGVACARTLLQAGHHVTVFEKERESGGRMATLATPFGSFDHGAQYFTVRDARFAQALATAQGLCKPWSANAVRVLDAHGRMAEAALPAREQHWVPSPGMNALVREWAAPIAQAGKLLLETCVERIERDALAPRHWQLRTEGPDGARHVYSGFDTVLMALPAVPAQSLLMVSGLAPALAEKIAAVQTGPCWTLMLAYPQAAQPTLSHLGPQWNAARSTHHRVAWLSRESSKPGRGSIERWTVQASTAWSAEHLEDDAPRVQAKLQRAFAEITGVLAEPAHAAVFRWRHAQTLRPLGKPFAWDARSRIGVCGDWCIGHRVEDAFVSGLDLALAVAQKP